MQNVLDFANELGLVAVIERAATYHPVKLHLGVVWNIPVEYTNRLQTTAGMCHYEGGLRITLNPALRAPSERQHLIETFLHELAHAHAAIVYGVRDGRGHGEHWWEMMHQLGQRPIRTHAIAACRKATDKATMSLDDMGL